MAAVINLVAVLQELDISVKNEKLSECAKEIVMTGCEIFAN